MCEVMGLQVSGIGFGLDTMMIRQGLWACRLCGVGMYAFM